MQLVAFFSHRNKQVRERKRFVLACFLWINFVVLANLAAAQDLNCLLYTSDAADE